MDGAHQFEDTPAPPAYFKAKAAVCNKCRLAVLPRDGKPVYPKLCPACGHGVWWARPLWCLVPKELSTPPEATNPNRKAPELPTILVPDSRN